jgi:RNA-directed DNA polymerase
MGKGGSVSVKEDSAMSQDAPVNSGAAAWPETESARAAVARMQTKLHRWAGEDTSRRFGDLFNLVYSPAFLVVAWQRVASSKGARTAGVDGLTVGQAIRDTGVEAFLDQIRTAVRSDRYEPAPVRQVKIPKGGGKFRTLGISTVADRVVQASLKLVLEPIFEADFQPCSYGFRPNRRAHDAIAEIHMLAAHGYHWVVEADVRACFDELGHTPILDRLRHRIKDKRVVALVRAFLKTGVMTTLGDREETPTGTPQGAILSPLIANIALSALDDHFTTRWRQDMGDRIQRAKRRRHGQANYKLIRFADDFVVIVHGERQHAEELRGQLADLLAPLGLQLSEAKTRVVHIDEGFDFLGTHIRRQRKRGTRKSYVYTKPSKKSIKEVKRKVSVATYRSTRHRPVEEMIDEVGQVLRGWANYHRHGVSKSVFAAVDSHAWWRLVSWLRRKHKRKRSRIGLREVRRRFCDRGWRLAHNGTVFTGAASVTVTRYRYRGDRIPTPWATRPAASNG